MNKPSDTLLVITRLNSTMRVTALRSCDVAFIVDVTPSYISHMFSDLVISKNMILKVKHLIDSLYVQQKDESLPIFGQKFAESSRNYIKRRMKLVARFKAIYKATMPSIDE